MLFCYEFNKQYQFLIWVGEIFISIITYTYQRESSCCRQYCVLSWWDKHTLPPSRETTKVNNYYKKIVEPRSKNRFWFKAIFGFTLNASVCSPCILSYRWWNSSREEEQHSPSCIILEKKMFSKAKSFIQ